MKRKFIFKKEFCSPHLYREDLAQIEQYLKESCFSGFKIETEDSEYESVDDIDIDTQAVSHLDIISVEPDISIKFSKNESIISSQATDAIAIGTCSKISEVILKRDRKTLYYGFFTLRWLVFVSSIYLSIFVIPKYLQDYLVYLNVNKGVGIVMPLVLGVITFVIIYLFFDFRFSPKIEFILKKDNPSFFKRNKDQLLLNLFSAILTGIVGFVLGRMTK